MSKAMVEQKQKERKFLEQLLDGTKVENYTIPVPIKAELRKYQQVRKHFSSILMYIGKKKKNLSNGWKIEGQSPQSRATIMDKSLGGLLHLWSFFSVHT